MTGLFAVLLLPLPPPDLKMRLTFLEALLTNPQWDRAEDDEEVKASVSRFTEKTMDLLEKEGLLHRWIYPNYANEKQDVFAGYGEKNRGKLREIQRKYDPEGVFSRLQPGYFKV
jgi:hypothetical protein